MAMVEDGSEDKMKYRELMEAPVHPSGAQRDTQLSMIDDDSSPQSNVIHNVSRIYDEDSSPYQPTSMGHNSPKHFEVYDDDVLSLLMKTSGATSELGLPSSPGYDDIDKLCMDKLNALIQRYVVDDMIVVFCMVICSVLFREWIRKIMMYCDYYVLQILTNSLITF